VTFTRLLRFCAKTSLTKQAIWCRNRFAYPHSGHAYLRSALTRAKSNVSPAGLQSRAAVTNAFLQCDGATLCVAAIARSERRARDPSTTKFLPQLPVDPTTVSIETCPIPAWRTASNTFTAPPNFALSSPRMSTRARVA